ncbi:MAG: FAD-binding protein [Oscillospiraceae bacterium]|jgi:succinate dehydrogenase/fumarate reductase flavoprotein subunit|nr:FAD-binding protein [Oscillospiraceae bacterium]
MIEHEKQGELLAGSSEYGKQADIIIVDSPIIKKPDDAPKRWSWETVPEPIPEGEVTETVVSDAIIVGGGISGLATAARATELGLKVTVIEKMGGFVAHGGEIASIGSSIQRAAGVHIDKKQFARDWIHISGSRVNEELLWIFINRSEEAFEWILQLGGGDLCAELEGAYYKGRDFTEYPGAHRVFKREGSTKYKYTGALLVCEILQGVITDGGSSVVRNTQALRLEKENGRVVSVLAKNKEGKIIRYKGTRGVVLATGDIGGDWEMLDAFSPWGLLPGKCSSWPEGSNLGEGHKIGYWAGGAFEPGPWALSLHMTGYAAFINFFLHVNARGKRYMNEDTWSGGKSARTVVQPGGPFGFTVFDSKWYDECARLAPLHGGQAFDPNNNYGDAWDNPSNNFARKFLEQYIEAGLAWKADSIEELAEKVGLPVDALTATVKRYNEVVASGDDTDFGKRSELLTPITEPPYYAAKFGPALLNVFGGLLTDTKLRVLDKEQNPLGGLLAVGMIAGGLYGVDYPLLLSGNSHGRCLTWGRLAAETLAADEA